YTPPMQDTATPKPRVTATRASHPSIALALGGGGARGIAHIPMLEALDEMGIRPKLIAGTSIGAIIGAAYASGIPGRHIAAHTEMILRQRFDLVRQIFSARALPMHRIMSLLQLKSAALRPEVLLGLVMPARVARDFADLKIPLKIVTTDIHGYQAVVFEKGPLVTAVAASMALPALFTPIAHEGRLLLDGGLVNPLPFDLIEGCADITVAIDVSGAGAVPDADVKHPTAMEALVTATQILQHTIVREKLRHSQPDLYIDMPVAHFGILDIHKFRDIIKAAQPAKETFKRQLDRVMNAHTLHAEPASQEKGNKN
ncbi:MAG: patatin-like phospholipase family protein, partial [Hyphomicrobiaceae bacterium]